MEEASIPSNQDALISLGAAHSKLIYCSKCNLTVSVGVPVVRPADAHSEMHKIAIDFPWARLFLCPKCHHQWAFCSQCFSSRNCITQYKQAKRHNTSKHNDKNVPASGGEDDASEPLTVSSKVLLAVSAQSDEDGIEVVMMDEVGRRREDDDNESCVVTGADDEEGVGIDDLQDDISIPEKEDCFVARRCSFSTPMNKAYFEMENISEGKGLAYLVARSQFGLQLVPEQLAEEDIVVQAGLAQLFGTFKKGQTQLFADVMASYQKLLVSRRPPSPALGDHKRLHPTLKRPFQTSIPTSTKRIRSSFHEGKNAFLTNLPVAPVEVLSEQHAYVSLIHVVEDFMAHGHDMDAINAISVGNGSAGNVRWCSESPRAKEIYENAKRMHDVENAMVVILYLNEWSDGFEPMASVKGNRGSTWVKTVTISPPRGMYNSVGNTYAIALGPSGSSHEEVERRFAEELKMLGSGPFRTFYHGGLKKEVYVHLEMFASLMDQPERRSANYIMLGTSQFSARWGHAGDFTQVSNAIPACPNCFNAIMNNTVLPNCLQCSRWDTSSRHGVLAFLPPKHYLSDELPASGKLLPFRLSYDLLISAATTAHDKIGDGTWSTKNATAYLRVHAINTIAMSDIVECANNCRTFRLAEERKNQHPIIDTSSYRPKNQKGRTYSKNGLARLYGPGELTFICTSTWACICSF